MKKYLFDEFDAISAADWKVKIQASLKGENYDDDLLWKSDEGVTVKPFYTSDDRHNTRIALPDKNYAICQSILVDDIRVANGLALENIRKGVNAIQFIAKTPFDYRRLLEKIDFINTTIYFNFEFLDENLVLEIENYFKGNHLVFFQIDPIGNLSKTGNWFFNSEQDILKTKKFATTVNHPIHIDASLYQNAGATIIQQLAYAIAHTNEYIEIFGKSIANKIHYSFSVGGNYFFEIAKLRAFRLLLCALFKEHGIPETSAHIFSKPSLRNKTIYDHNVNMLRTTSECMSAIFGGANTICNCAYDAMYHRPNEFAARIARNQLLILQEEASLLKAHKIPNGVYYIESIERQFAEKSLEIVKKIERNGGFLEQLKDGAIQKEINEKAEREQKQFDQNQISLLGTNKLPQENDRMKNEIELYPFFKERNSNKLVTQIIQKRLSETYEKKRLELENE